MEKSNVRLIVRLNALFGQSHTNRQFVVLSCLCLSILSLADLVLSVLAGVCSGGPSVSRDRASAVFFLRVFSFSILCFPVRAQTSSC